MLVLFAPMGCSLTLTNSVLGGCGPRCCTGWWGTSRWCQGKPKHTGSPERGRKTFKKGFDVIFKQYQDVRKRLKIIRFKSTSCFRDVVAPPVCFTDLQNVLHFQDAAVGDGGWQRGGNGQHQLGVHLGCVGTDGMPGHGGHALGN